jgi:predicted Rossmann-fold nucleotide-binding protein
MTRVFISHSSVDKPFARKLVADLEAAGLQVWFDENVIRPGDSIVGSVSRGLKESDYTLLVISESFLNSKWAAWEANAAIVDAINENKSSVIPLLVEDVWNNVSPLLRDRLYVDFRSHKNLLQYRDELGKLLVTLLGSAASIKIQGNPTIMATGGRDLTQTKQLEVAYELGRLLGAHRYRLITGCARGVDEHFARGASEGLREAGANERDFLTTFIPKGRSSHHAFGKQLHSRLRAREEGIPEMVEQADIAVLLGGSKNTSYLGVLSLLEGKVVLPIEYTEGAAADLYSLLITRYHKVFGSRLDRAKFEDLADRSRTPEEIAEACLALIKIVSGS